MASNCTAQNQPKRFKQPYLSATATQARASTFLSELRREEKGGWMHRESATTCECLDEAHASRAQRIH